MDNSKNPEIREGSPTAHEVYLSVGMALSWWEASEDVIEMLFEHLCHEKEPIAIETFRVAPRQSRSIMMKSALQYQSGKVQPDEAADVLDALKKLEKLSTMRNQIAHGRVSEISENVNGSITVKGNFLCSTISPTGVLMPRSANKKYAYSAKEIDQWRDKVRHERGRVMDIYSAVFERAPLNIQSLEALFGRLGIDTKSRE